LKSKIILSGLFLTGAVSCASFKPVILTNAFIDPESTTNVDSEDLNFSYALFNQYASGLDYTIRLNYSVLGNSNNVNFAVRTFYNGVYEFFQDWDIVTSTYAEAKLKAPWKNRFNDILFARNFDRVSKLANVAPTIDLFKQDIQQLYFSINITSSISYKVNIGSIFLAYLSYVDPLVDDYNMFIKFEDGNNNVLQIVRLTTNRSNTYLNQVFDMPKIITNVKSFELWVEWIDIPPFAVGLFQARTELHEFNIFTQQQEISIPDNSSGDRFGFSFVAVEWWDILGHLQNFVWWIVNQSPVAPVFEWIEDYIITWVSGLITFITGVFRL